MQQIVVFSVNNESYCLYIHDINEIIKLHEIKKIHEAPEFIEGLINIRGKIHAIINMRKKLNEPFEGYGEYNKIILIKHASVQAGILVDDAHEILKVDKSAIDLDETHIKARNRRFISGTFKTANKDIYLLDINALYSAAEEGILQATV